MQQSVLKFIAWSRRRCSACFGKHYYAHHQELFQTVVAASSFRINAEVDVFLAVGGLLATHPPRHLYGNRRLRLQFKRAPDDGHNGTRNLLSSVYATKQ
jgi:hypothetical protein